jgi:hypothetical protein
MKTCTKCNLEKPFSEFSLRGEEEKLRSWCKQCVNEGYSIARDRRWKEDPEGFRAYKAKVKRNRAWNRFGITQDQFEELGELQNWSCLICGTDITNRPQMDHNHRTNQVRNLLCFHCNVGLGHFRDSVVLLEKAIIYLKVYDE